MPSPARGSGGGRGGGNIAQLFCQLKPIGVRKATADEIITRIRRKTSGMPGASLFLQSNQDIRVGGRQGNAQYQYTMQTQELNLLALWGPRVLDGSRTLPEIADVSSDQQNSGLSENVVIDRDTASRLGLTAQAVDSALYDAFGQRQVSTMYKSINQYHVVLALEQKWWSSPEVLDKVYVQTPRGIEVPISAFAHWSEGDHAPLAAASGAVPGLHHFLQSGRWRIAQRCRSRHQQGGDRHGPARQHHRQVRRAPRRLFRTRSRISPS